MPKQKYPPPENSPISFRPGRLQRRRLAELIQHRGQNQSAVLNAAIDMLYLFDFGFLYEAKDADVLTDFGRNDPAEDEQ